MISRVGQDANKNALNAFILANTGGTQGAAGKWDGLVDFTGTPIGQDGAYANTMYFTGDEIHTNVFSRQTIEAPAFQAAVLAIN